MPAAIAALVLLAAAAGCAAGSDATRQDMSAGGTSGGGQGGAGGASAGRGGSTGAGTGGSTATGRGGSGGGTPTGLGGMPGSDPTAYLPWNDGFEDMTFVSHNWRTADTNGTWSVITDGTHVYQAVGSGTETIAVTGDVYWIDQMVQVKVKVTSASSSSWAVDLLPRFLDLRNYYQLTVGSPGTELEFAL